MKAVATTDTGRVRATNQDNIYCSTSQVGPLPNLFAVADGMGGGKAGDYASRSAIEELVRLIGSYSGKVHEGDAFFPSIVNYAVRNTNLKLYMESCEDDALEGMGSTLVLCSVIGDTLWTCNVGDSRLYVLDKHSIRQITKDHSYVEELVAQGIIDKDSEDYKRQKNLITRAMGIGRNVDADIFSHTMLPGEKILMCSDGLSNMIEDSRILGIVNRNPDIEAAMKELVFEANLVGGSDNISVILISGEESEEGL